MSSDIHMNDIHPTDRAGSSTSTDTSAIQKMIGKVLKSPNAFYRNQQRGEPDLCDEEKYQICSKLYVDFPSKFLSRYHKFLDSDDVDCFQDSRRAAEDENAKFEFDYYLQEMAKKKSTSNHRDSMAKNRRYAALKRLISEGKYFSDYEMRERDPLFYEHMVGQYQTESEQREAFHSGDQGVDRLSSALLDMYDATERAKRCDSQVSKQTTANYDHQQNERIGHDSDIEDDESELEDEENAMESLNSAKRTVPDAEKDVMREEFIREMHERFLDGRDTSFDYRTVDENSEYDPVDLQARDAEDRYFDEEEPEEWKNQDVMQSG